MFLANTSRSHALPLANGTEAERMGRAQNYTKYVIREKDKNFKNEINGPNEHTHTHPHTNARAHTHSQNKNSKEIGTVVKQMRKK